jgi:hypothetical protein
MQEKLLPHFRILLRKASAIGYKSIEIPPLSMCFRSTSDLTFAAYTATDNPLTRISTYQMKGTIIQIKSIT